MKNILLFILCVNTSWLHAQDRGFITPKGTERRIAFVVGNLNYQNIKKLKNSLNDANDMAVSLEKLGFEVIKVTDADYRSFVGGLNRFKDKLKTSDVAFFYFAGHGASFNNKNYLLPTDASIECLENIEEYGISLNRIVSEIESKQVKNSFIVLDACRDMPERKSCDASRGALDENHLVAYTNNPEGNMIIYATADGKTSSDNETGRNGLFTEAFLRYLTTPDLSIRAITDETFKAVRAKSKNVQKPTRTDNLLGDFYFIKRATHAQVTNEVEKETPKTTPTLINGVSTKKFMDLPFAEMVYVQGGTFQMGDTRDEVYDNEKPVHSVKVSDFWMGKYEVTQAQWESIMGSNPSYFKDCPSCPVEQVTWDDVQEFLKKLNAKTGINYRLPTEAEWEYAAGGGNSSNRSRFGNGEDILRANEANFNGSSELKATYSEAGEYRGKPIVVGSLGHANSLGIHDMVGNVLEWCSDWHGIYTSSPSFNPVGASSGTTRVLRGGSWGNGPQFCRVADRYYYTPSYRNIYVGFRVVSP